jgi:hypothetical protein
VFETGIGWEYQFVSLNLSQRENWMNSMEDKVVPNATMECDTWIKKKFKESGFMRN